MKKIIALVICMLLLLSGCATAGDGVGVRFGLGNLVTTENGETKMDMTGMSFTLETAEQDGVAGMRLAFNAIGGSPAEIIATVEGESVIVSVHGANGGHVYLIEDPEFAETMDGFIKGVGASETSDEELPEDYELSDEELAELQAQLEELMSAYSDEELAEMEAQSQKMSEMIEECFKPAGTKEIDGITYEVTEIDVSYDKLVEILDMTGSEDSSFGQSLDELGAEINFSGEMGSAETGELYLGLDVGVAKQSGEEIGAAHVGIDASDPAAATLELSIDAEGEQLLGISLDLLGGAVEDAPWMDVDTTDAYVVTGDDTDGLADVLSEDATDFLMTCINAVAGSGLQSQIESLLAGIGLD